MANPIFVIDIGPDGIVAAHPRRTELPLHVAPVTEAEKDKKSNAVRLPLVAIGCMMLPGATGFAFDSSLVSPGAEKKLTAFAELMLALQRQDEQKRMPPCTVFGHADPTGKQSYNRMLSGRRAMAVYGVLTRNEKVWDHLFTTAYGHDEWGDKAIQTMLSAALVDEDTPGAAKSPPFFAGAIDGKKSPELTDAIKAWQVSRGIKDDGKLDKNERHRLFREYMDSICHDKKGQPFRLAATDFLARGRCTDQGTGGLPQLRGDVQGCGEFNPIVILSQAKLDEFEKAEDKEAGKEARNEAYHEDRRVLVYVFKHGSEIDHKKGWPCPAALGEDTATCKGRLWADGEKVRLVPDPVLTRRFRGHGGDQDLASDEVETRNTMGCRFYFGFAALAPCEAGVRRWRVRFRLEPTAAGDDPVPLRNRRYVVVAGSTDQAPLLRGRTDDDGEIAIPLFEERVQLTVKIDAWGPLDPKPAGDDPPPKEEEPDPNATDSDAFPDEDKFLPITLEAGSLPKATGDTRVDGAKQRLFNLGFGQRRPEQWDAEELRLAVRGYRRTRNGKRGVTEGEVLDDTTIESLRQEHDVEGPPPPNDDDEGGA
ncbi:MAG: OmpA family protein [Planctomycetota bacterium]